MYTNKMGDKKDTENHKQTKNQRKDQKPLGTTFISEDRVVSKWPK
jgi:hypothetical protein